MKSQDMSYFIQILKINVSKNNLFLLAKYSSNYSNFIVKESFEQLNNIVLLCPNMLAIRYL